MKQTAVEWFAAHVNHVIDLHSKKLISEDKFRSLLIEYREQAEQMEHKQILDTARYYFHERGKLTAEQYYKETFKSEIITDINLDENDIKKINDYVKNETFKSE